MTKDEGRDDASCGRPWAWVVGSVPGRQTLGLGGRPCPQGPCRRGDFRSALRAGAASLYSRGSLTSGPACVSRMPAPFWLISLAAFGGCARRMEGGMSAFRGHAALALSSVSLQMKFEPEMPPFQKSERRHPAHGQAASPLKRTQSLADMRLSFASLTQKGCGAPAAPKTRVNPVGKRTSFFDALERAEPAMSKWYGKGQRK